MRAYESINTSGMDSPAPIFIIGSYRSATSATTWAIGQHPNIFPLEETNFLGKLSIDLGIQHELGSDRGARTFLSSAGFTRWEYCQFFGSCLDRLVMNSRQRIVDRSRSAAANGKRVADIDSLLSFPDSGQKSRWVDGTPENSHYVLPLSRMFPRAKFIFMLRHPSEVARSLIHFQSIGGGVYSEERAYTLWSELTRACALAERALGSGVVLRVRYEEIAEDPGQALQRCLTFVGEEMHEQCVTPFRERINASVIPSNLKQQARGKPPPYVTEAVALYESLVSGDFERDWSRYRALKELAKKLKAHEQLFHPATVSEILRKKRQLEHKHRPLRVKLWNANKRVLAHLSSFARRATSALR